MPENQTQANQAGAPHAQGGPQAADAGEDKSFRPSDTEALHQPDEGGVAVRDPRLQGEDPDRAALSGQGGHGRDRREDYGQVRGAEGTDRLTAGAEAADRLPDAAVKTSAKDAGTST